MQPTRAPQQRHAVVREEYRRVVLAAITRSGPTTKAELVARTGMSRPTIAALVDELCGERLVAEIGHARPTGGRAAAQFAVNALAAVAIGIDLGATKLAGALADLDGRILVEQVVPTPRAAGAPALAAVVDLARGLVDAAQLEWSAVAQVAVGVPFSVAADGVITNGSNIAGLEGVNVRSYLGERLETGLAVENDVNQAAFGELEQGIGRTVASFAFVAVGTGLGAGIVADGQLLRGTRGAAGELAYLPMIGDRRRTGRGGVQLEAAVTQRGYRGALRAELGAGAASAVSPRSTIGEILDAAGAGDRVAQRVVDDRAAIFADALIALAAIADPEVVVLGGGVGSHPVLVDATARAVDRRSPWPLPVSASLLGPRAGLLGGIGIAVRDARAGLDLPLGPPR